MQRTALVREVGLEVLPPSLRKSRDAAWTPDVTFLLVQVGPGLVQLDL